MHSTKRRRLHSTLCTPLRKGRTLPNGCINSIIKFNINWIGQLLPKWTRQINYFVIINWDFGRSCISQQLAPSLHRSENVESMAIASGIDKRAFVANTTKWHCGATSLHVEVFTPLVMMSSVCHDALTTKIRCHANDMAEGGMEAMDHKNNNDNKNPSPFATLIYAAAQPTYKLSTRKYAKRKR